LASETIIAFVVVPVMVASEAAKGARAGDIMRSMATNPFLIAVTVGVLFNVTGLYGAIVVSPVGPAITSTLSTATKCVTGTGALTHP
jgi:predicted permease